MLRLVSALESTRFESPGLSITDNIHKRQVQLLTTEPVTPTPTDTEDFVFPVEEAVTIETAAVRLPTLEAAYVRDPSSGDLRQAIPQDGRRRVEPDARQLIELQTPVRVYLLVPAGVGADIETAPRKLAVKLDDPTAVDVGVRSQHSRPIGTVTTTSAPRDLMAAVETMPAALQTLSPERSWPTLRGHPPRLELGDRLDIPEQVEPPDTGIEIAIPADRDAIYQVTPLVYYLGASLTVSDTPAVRVDGQRVADLTEPAPIGCAASRFLKQVFTLDCLTRTVGLYDDLDIHARNVADDRLGYDDADWRALYETSPGDRLANYAGLLEDDPAVVEDVAPRWRHSSFVDSSDSVITHLPYLAHDLAVIRPAPSKDVSTPAEPLQEFVRAPTESQPESGALAPEPRELLRSEDEQPAREEYIGLPETGTPETTFAGDGIPLGGGKLLPAAYGARFDEQASTNISVTVVCNDDAMWQEYSDRPLYGGRDALEFDLDVHRNTSVEELAALLRGASDVDFMHFIGHVSNGTELVCSDGTLPLGSLREEIDPPRVVLVNGCSSLDVGLEFIDAGGMAGIITVSPVGNANAMLIGQHVARLINQGFSPRSALAVVKTYGAADNKYLSVGDAGLEVAQSESGAPIVTHLESIPDGGFEVCIEVFPPANDGMGALYRPNIEGADAHELSGGFTQTFEVSREDARSYLELDFRMPVVLDGELTWSTELEL